MAIAFENPSEEPDDDPDGPPSQLLVIAFGSRDGGFRLASTKIPLAGKGMLGVDQDNPKLRIQRGTLLVSESGGSAHATYTLTNRYRHEGRSWRLIGETSEGWNEAEDAQGNPYPDAPDLEHSTDTNLLTGSVRTTKQVVAVVKGGEVTKLRLVKATHRMLRATRAVSAPALEGPGALLDWQAYPLRLEEHRNGATLSAELRAVCADVRLWLQIRLKGEGSGDEARVSLVDEKGHRVVPEGGVWTPTQDGETWMGSFPFKPEEAFEGRTLEIQSDERILTTTGTSPGEIRVVDEPGLPIYEDDER